MINIIAAVGKNNELGLNNHLLWHLPKDLKFFKEKTNNHIIVMGYNTFVSLGRLLPNRTHVVLSYNHNDFVDEVIHFSDYNELLKFIKNKDVFIIGGASIYKLFIDIADNIYLTEINDSKECDVYFPNFDKNLYDKEILGQENDNGIFYQFTLYKRRKL